MKNFHSLNRLLIALLCTSILVAACKKDNEPQDDSPEETTTITEADLTGTWNVQKETIVNCSDPDEDATTDYDYTACDPGKCYQFIFESDGELTSHLERVGYTSYFEGAEWAIVDGTDIEFCFFDCGKAKAALENGQLTLIFEENFDVLDYSYDFNGCKRTLVLKKEE